MPSTEGGHNIRKRMLRMRYEEPSDVVSLGSAWAGNSVNCSSFRINGILSRGGIRYVGFYDSSGDVVVASLMADKRTARVVIPNVRKPFDAHVAISLGLDGNGHLHVAYGAHDSAMQIARTRSPGLDEGLSHPVRLGSDFAEKASYPMFLSPLASGDLILLFRDGVAASSDIRVMRFDCAASCWRDDPVALLSGRAGPGWQAGPYLNTPAIGPHGEIVLFVVWRLDPRASTAGAVTNSGIDCLVSNDRLHHLSTAAGIGVRLPVTPATAERVIAVPLGANLINQAGAAVRADGTPMVATYWNDQTEVPQYRLGWREGSCWRVSTISQFSGRFRLAGDASSPPQPSRAAAGSERHGTCDFPEPRVRRTLSPDVPQTSGLRSYQRAPLHSGQRGSGLLRAGRRSSRLGQRRPCCICPTVRSGTG